MAADAFASSRVSKLLSAFPALSLKTLLYYFFKAGLLAMISL